MQCCTVGTHKADGCMQLRGAAERIACKCSWMWFNSLKSVKGWRGYLRCRCHLANWTCVAGRYGQKQLRECTALCILDYLINCRLGLFDRREREAVVFAIWCCLACIREHPLCVWQCVLKGGGEGTLQIKFRQLGLSGCSIGTAVLQPPDCSRTVVRTDQAP